jgi:8-oxo-dGTP diphosphatase
MADTGSPGLPDQVSAAYGNRIRVRVGALIFDEPRDPRAVLLVEHFGIHGPESFWTPPGGGIEFGESLADGLRREVREETGLHTTVGPLRYVLDFIRPPLHAVSFYFEAQSEAGRPRTGSDPELGEQLIRSVRFVPFEELDRLNVYPEGLAERLPGDARDGFAAGMHYLGTLS